MKFQTRQLLKLGERCVLAICFALLSLFVLSVAVLEWDWRGTVVVPGQSLQWVIELGNSDGTWSACLYKQGQ